MELFDIYLPKVSFDKDGNPYGVHCATEVPRRGTKGVFYHCLATKEQIEKLGSAMFKHPSERFLYMKNSDDSERHEYFGRKISDMKVLEAEEV